MTANAAVPQFQLLNGGVLVYHGCHIFCPVVAKLVPTEIEDLQLCLELNHFGDSLDIHSLGALGCEVELILVLVLSIDASAPISLNCFVLL